MDLDIRPVRGTEELRACEELQRHAWDLHDDLEVVSVTHLVATVKAGGILLGAFDDDLMVGFCYGFLGRREGRLLHWSHMTAVQAGHRDSGVGAALKWAQRREALEQGLETMAWTYDPLESRNAYFNFSKLGIVARRYWLDVYGETASPLHRGIPTDRFMAEWHLASERVASRAAGERGPTALPRDPRPPFVLQAERRGEWPLPGRPALELEEPRLLCEIPDDIQALKVADVQAASAWRQATRAVFTHYLEAGYRVRECIRIRESTPRTCYLLEHDDPAPDLLRD